MELKFLKNDKLKKLLGLFSLYLVYSLLYKHFIVSFLWKKIFHSYDMQTIVKLDMLARSITLIIYIFVIYVLLKNKLGLDDSRKINLIKSILLSLVVFLIDYFFISKITLYIEKFLFGSLSSPAGDFSTKIIKEMPIDIINVGILAPIMEELAFRKGLFSFLYELHSGCNKCVRVVTSVLISSIMFGAIHNGYFHQSMIYYTTFGILCSLLYLYTKRISSAIIIHILFNLTWAVMTIYS